MTTESTLDRVQRRGVLRIAVSFTPPPETGHAPEFYRDASTGEPTGVVPELGKVMAHNLGVHPEFVDMPWPKHMSALLAEHVDLLMSYTNTPERAFKVEFAGRLLPSEVVLVLRRESSVTDVQSLHQPGARLGVWHGSSIAVVARERFPHATVVEFEEPACALLAGDVDACVMDAVTRVFMEQHTQLRLLRDTEGQLVVLAREYGHPAIRPGDQRFLNWINSWLDYHRAQGTIEYWCSSWWRSWMAQ